MHTNIFSIFLLKILVQLLVGKKKPIPENRNGELFKHEKKFCFPIQGIMDTKTGLLNANWILLLCCK